MTTISGDSTLLEVAAIVSAALEEAGLKSVLSGGAAISIYTENRYESVDLDFVSSAAMHELAKILDHSGLSAAPKGAPDTSSTRIAHGTSSSRRSRWPLAAGSLAPTNGTP